MNGLQKIPAAIRAYRLTALAAILFITCTLQAANSGIPKLDSANALYNKKSFKKAAALYEEVINSGKPAAEIYYNLGNAYYRSNNIGLSILNYERALRLSPNDEDIRYNLNLARQRTVDQFEDAGMVLGNAWQNFLAAVGESGWSWLTAAALVLALALFYLFSWSKKTGVKRLSFFSGIFLLAACIFCFVCARQQNHYTYKSRTGIILPASVTVYSSPLPKSESITTLHEGAKVRIRETENDWYRISFGSNADGWVKKATLEEI